MAKLECGATVEKRYLGFPVRRFEGKFTYPSNDPDFRDGEFLGKEFRVDVELAIHPNESKRIIINVPGLGGEIDGYKRKYVKLANYMQRSNLGAVVRTDNGGVTGYLCDVMLRAALQYARENAFSICGETEPDVYLMGFSAGASAIAAVGHEYPEVKGILLYAPSGNMPTEQIKDGLGKFRGNVYIVQGEEDEVVGADAGKMFFSMATGAGHRELFMIPSCDHQFRGEANGRIMSEAPFYAFAIDPLDTPVFPNPKRGIKLYGSGGSFFV